MRDTFYDPEYDRLVDITYVKHQYEWFRQHGLDKTLEQFIADNFEEVH